MSKSAARLSPEGATDSSQGWQPLVRNGKQSRQPHRGDTHFTQIFVSPRWGLGLLLRLVSRGCHPWLLSVAPLGLNKLQFMLDASQANR